MAVVHAAPRPAHGLLLYNTLGRHVSRGTGDPKTETGGWRFRVRTQTSYTPGQTIDRYSGLVILVPALVDQVRSMVRAPLHTIQPTAVVCLPCHVFDPAKVTAEEIW